jgi:hypothetical protein
MCNKLLFLSIILFLTSCGNDESVDISYPTINMDTADAFPQNCVELLRGESFTFKAIFTDNNELGSYNIDIHHNFDHHSTHSDDQIECALNERRSAEQIRALQDAGRILNLSQSVRIPAGQTSFNAELEIEIPATTEPGDYHFSVSVIDASGWQTLKGISIKIVD